MAGPLSCLFFDAMQVYDQLGSRMDSGVHLFAHMIVELLDSKCLSESYS